MKNKRSYEAAAGNVPLGFLKLPVAIQLGPPPWAAGHQIAVLTELIIAIR